MFVSQGVMEGVPASRGYSGGFSAALMLKDLRLAATASETCAAPLHMGRAAEQLYKQVTCVRQHVCAYLARCSMCILMFCGAACRSIKTLTLEQFSETSMLQASNTAMCLANPPSFSALAEVNSQAANENG